MSFFCSLFSKPTLLSRSGAIKASTKARDKGPKVVRYFFHRCRKIRCSCLVWLYRLLYNRLRLPTFCMSISLKRVVQYASNLPRNRRVYRGVPRAKKCSIAHEITSDSTGHGDTRSNASASSSTPTTADCLRPCDPTYSWRLGQCAAARKHTRRAVEEVRATRAVPAQRVPAACLWKRDYGVRMTMRASACTSTLTTFCLIVRQWSVECRRQWRRIARSSASRVCTDS